MMARRLIGKVIGIIGYVQVAVLSAAVGAEPPGTSIGGTGLSSSTVVISIPPATERWKKLAVAAFEGLANRRQGSVYTLWPIFYSKSRFGAKKLLKTPIFGSFHFSKFKM